MLPPFLNIFCKYVEDEDNEVHGIFENIPDIAPASFLEGGYSLHFQIMFAKVQKIKMVTTMTKKMKDSKDILDITVAIVIYSHIYPYPYLSMLTYILQPPLAFILT